MIKDYIIGIDLGDNTNGYAVIGEEGELLRFKNHDMWGVRLHNAAETKIERRKFRCARRRITRRRTRILLLQELMAPLIRESDAGFYQRLNSADLLATDKDDRMTLFNDEGFTDKEYYQQYPTIFHLRRDLVLSDKKFDIRLVYLAMHNIIKYRGNFLFEGMQFNSQNINNVINDNLNQLDSMFDEYYHKEYGFINLNLLSIIVKNQSKRAMQDEMKTTLNISGKDTTISEIFKLLSGATADISKIFTNIEFDKSHNVKLSEVEDDNIDVLESLLGDEYAIFESIKLIFDACFAFGILRDNNYISECMVDKYDKHRQDLIALKDILRKYYDIGDKNKTEYNKWFKGDNSIYGHYVGHSKAIKVDDYYNGVKSFLTATRTMITDNDTALIQINNMLSDVDDGKFMPRQVSKDNTLIPYQFHCNELQTIIDNQSRYYPELAEIKDKVLSIMKFRIPYYVGPLNTASPFSWVVRSNEKIYPWNFTDVVNLDDSEEKFILRMTNKCTYLFGKDVLPKGSMLYEEYCLLCELNSIRVDNKPLSSLTKDIVIDKLFKYGKTVKESRFIDCLKLYCDYKEINTITGYQKDKEFASTLKSYSKFYRILGDKLESGKITHAAERIILIATILSDKDRVTKRIRNEFADLFTDKEIESLGSLKFNKWGRLSKEFLTDMHATCKKNNEKTNIMEVLRSEPYVLTQLLYDSNYNFMEIIGKTNSESLTNGKDYIEEAISSPKVRKTARQCLKIIDEIIAIMGKPPTKIIMESTRSDEDKIRTETRISTMKKMLAKAEKDANDNTLPFLPEVKHIRSMVQGLKNDDIKKEKEYLYFTQLGKCMYTAQALDYDMLYSYEVDHILPQSLVKDDSLDNKVLVTKISNAQKSDDKVIAYNIRKAQDSYWKYLAKNELISAKKLKNLTRSRYSDKDIAGFIARQLVDTSWATKAVSTVLEEKYKGTKIVTIKASVASHFREKFGYIKCRALNNFHHAKDAYLVAVLGNIYDELFGKSPYDYLIANKFGNNRENNLNSKTYYLHNMLNTEIQKKDKDAIMWKGEDSLTRVRSIMAKNTPVISYKLEFPAGKLFDQNVVSKKLGLMPKKTSGFKSEHYINTDIYGGYTGRDAHHFVLFRCTDGNKRKLIIERVTIYDSRKIKTSEDLLRYLGGLGYTDIDMINDNILLNQLVEINGNQFYLTGHSGVVLKLKQANEFIVNKDMYSDIVAILNSDEESLKAYISRIQSTPNEYLRIEAMINNCYMYVINKMCRSPYKNIPGYAPAIKVLEESLDKFLPLDTEINVIKMIFKMLGGSFGDFVNIGGKKNMGTVNIGKNLTNTKFAFITKSATGLFSHKVIINDPQ